MLSDEELQPLVADELSGLADLLETLPEGRWDVPSLCAGWRVREVVAHMTMAARYDQNAFMAELAACDHDFNRLSDTIAARDAELPTSELVTNLRSKTMRHWTPPGGGYRGALNHAVIHGLDITVPLGRPRRPTDPTLVVVLDDLTRGGVHAHFGTDISKHAFRATDIDWSYGTGPVLSGPASDIALHLCQRTLPENDLHPADQ